MIYVILILIALQIFFLLIKVRLKIINRDYFHIDLILSRIFNIKINLDDNDSENNDFKSTLDNLKFYWRERDFLKALAKRSWVNKVTVIPRRNIEDPIFNVYLLFLEWQFLSFIQMFIDRNFVSQKDRYYQVVYQEKANNKHLVFEIEIETRIFYIIYLLIKYPKSTSKVIFNRKEKRSERTSD